MKQAKLIPNCLEQNRNIIGRCWDGPIQVVLEPIQIPHGGENSMNLSKNSFWNSMNSGGMRKPNFFQSYRLSTYLKTVDCAKSKCFRIRITKLK